MASRQLNGQPNRQSNKRAKQTQKARAYESVRIGIVAALIIVLIGVGAFIFHGFRDIYSKKTQAKDSLHPGTANIVPQAQADAVFRKYLVKMVAAKGKYSAENYTPTAGQNASAITGRAVYDALQKSAFTSLSYKCTATVDNAAVMLNITVQTQNADTYVRLNDISGQITDSNARAKGVWYKTAQSDPVIQAELDAGVFVFDAAVVAPTYDAEKVADALIASKTYSYIVDKHIGDTYTFSLTTNKNNYVTAVKQAFPSLANPEAVVGAVFADDAAEMNSALMVSQDGTLVNELGLRSDACPDIASLYLGANIQRTTGMLNALSINKPADNVPIIPVTKFKPITGYGK